MTAYEINSKINQIYKIVDQLKGIAEELQFTDSDDIIHCSKVIADYAKEISHIAEDYRPIPSYERQ